MDWFTLPQGNHQRQIEQIEGMRAWLDSIPALRGKEIWVTEIGILWGFPGVRWEQGIAHPVGEFDYVHVERYMRALFGWFDANAERLTIGKWFLWGVFQYAEPWESVAGAITLMDGPMAGSNITRFGRLYQQLAGVGR